MHVDWDWIKQRPHFLAQYLGQRYQLCICYPFSRIRSVLTRNSRQGLKLCPFVLIRRRPAWIHAPFRQALRVVLGLVIRIFRPHCVWLTHPLLYDYLPQTLNLPVVYASMDDALGFASAGQDESVLRELEFRLVERAAHVFCTSAHLRSKLMHRYPCSGKCTLVRNAYDPDFAEPDLDRSSGIEQTSIRVAMGYVGTVSAWLDVQALQYCLRSCAYLDIHLLGPVEQKDPALQGESRVYFHGPVQHSSLPAWVASFDLLIMPFQVTELTLSVDPVKLYEYIFFYKPILSVYYPELERFADFVTFYSDYPELVAGIERIKRRHFQPGYSYQARNDFLTSNSWTSRMEHINTVLDKVIAQDAP